MSRQTDDNLEAQEAISKEDVHVHGFNRRSGGWLNSVMLGTLGSARKFFDEDKTASPSAWTESESPKASIASSDCERNQGNGLVYKDKRLLWDVNGNAATGTVIPSRTKAPHCIVIVDEDESDDEDASTEKNSSSLQPSQHSNSMEISKVSPPPTLNIPDEQGFVPLLRAILEGHNTTMIKKLLDDGASPNLKTNDNCNAAHLVIKSLIEKKRDVLESLSILDLLIAKGFHRHLLNEGNNHGCTLLLTLMQYADLNEELLNWFFDYGCDFNAVPDEKKFGNSVLFQAIFKRHTRSILEKILEFGGNVNHVTNRKWNALHQSARYANDSALEIILNHPHFRLDVNERTLHGLTPLHLLFVDGDLDYQRCLEILLDKGADFGKKDEHGYVPLVRWILLYRGNCFATLLKMKDRLPITPHIAFATLNALKQEMVVHRHNKFLLTSSRDKEDDLVKFTSFLVEKTKWTFKVQIWAKFRKLFASLKI